jgi:hypothetical protein
MAKLTSRLQQLRALREQGGLSFSGSRESGGKAGAPAAVRWRGWDEAAPFVWRRRTELALETVIPPLQGLFLSGPDDIDDLMFYDFETTGLSGGAGTLIFLAGFGILQRNSIQIEQLFLTDYPGEANFLRKISSLLQPRHLYVSYNGKSFDRNILLNRYRLNRMEAPDMPRQLDLLYPSRALWRRSLENCSLGRIEGDVLGIEREADIPGLLIPQCYQDFLRGRDEGCIHRVVAHHLQDIVSLAYLLFLIENAASDPHILGHSEARTGMGLLLLRNGDPRGIAVLEEELAAGSERAGVGLAGYYKRSGSHDDLYRVLKRMLQLRPGYFQAEEMAKLQEHRHGQPEEALRTIEDLMRNRMVFTAGQKASLMHRRRRLMEKAAKRKSSV